MSFTRLEINGVIADAALVHRKAGCIDILVPEDAPPSSGCPQ